MRSVIVAAALVLSPMTAALSLVVSTPTPAFASVLVRPGDTLTSIAARYHTTVAALVAANHISNPNMVVIGTTLQVPTQPVALSAVVAPSSSTVVVHTWVTR